MLAQRPCLGNLILLALAVSMTAVCAAVALPAPQGDRWTTWSVEQAGREGQWKFSQPSATGTHFASPGEAGNCPHSSPSRWDRPARLRVKPVWWPTGEQKLSLRYPYPAGAPARPGGPRLCREYRLRHRPAAGLVVAFNATTETVIGVTEVGGYLSDLVADREHGQVYVADALGDRVVILGGKTRVILRRDPRAGRPLVAGAGRRPPLRRLPGEQESPRHQHRQRQDGQKELPLRPPRPRSRWSPHRRRSSWCATSSRPTTSSPSPPARRTPPSSCRCPPPAAPLSHPKAAVAQIAAASGSTRSVRIP